MKHFLLLTVISLLFWSCQEQKDFSTVDPVNWKKRAIKDVSVLDSLEQGTTYLSVYSEIYSLSEHRTHDLTATISLRNTHRSDSVFLTKAEYFNTEGDLIRTYFTDPIYLKPMETVEIVIDEIDKEGGTGAWAEHGSGRWGCDCQRSVIPTGLCTVLMLPVRVRAVA